jgi:tripartite-type tricarboxylate transporter receptor subunit TctC
MKRRTLLIATGVTAACALPAAQAQSFPNKPIRLIVPFAAGGSTDVVARLVADPLSRLLGQTVVVENKGGAGGAIGTMEVVRAAPDGHTLLLASPSVTAANPAINPAAGYDPLADLVPIVNVAAGPTVLAVHPSFPARTYAEFIAELKRHPDRYSYASPGVGGIIHLQMEAFKSLTATSIQHVPFRGAGPGLTAVVGGQVHVIQDSLPSSQQFVRDGRLIALAVTAPERRPDLPGVPTFAEVGLASLNYMGHFGILGPKGLPKDIVAKINTAVRRSVEEPAVRKRLEDSGIVVVASSPEDFAAEIKTMFEQAKKVVVERKLTLE